MSVVGEIAEGVDRGQSIRLVPIKAPIDQLQTTCTAIDHGDSRVIAKSKTYAFETHR